MIARQWIDPILYYYVDQSNGTLMIIRTLILCLVAIEAFLNHWCR